MKAMPMSPQQRCEAVLAHRTADRAPTYMPAIACDVASKLLGREARTGTGSLHYAEIAAWSNGEAAHAEFEQRMFQDLYDLHRMLEIDVFRMPWRMNVRPTKRLDEYTFLLGDPEGSHSLWRYNPDSADFGVIQRSTDSASPEVAIRDAVERDEAGAQRRAAAIRAAVQRHRSVVERFGGDFHVIAAGGDMTVGAEEQDLMALALEPELMARKLMCQAQDAVAFGEAMRDARVPVVMAGGGDMAGNTGPLYSPEAFRGVVLPAYRHALGQLNAMGAHYMFRSDGNLWAVADMIFAESGCPGYGEADRDAGMTLAALRQRYPKLVVWGNLASSFLVKHDARQVRDEARRILDESEGRGYFQGCSNAIVHGTPPENVLAMFSVR